MVKELNCTECTKPCLHKVIDPSDLQELNANKIEMSFKAGEKILRQGSFVAQFGYLKKGIAKTIIEDKNNKNTLLYILNDGDYMALSIIGKPNVYPFSVVAITDCDICYIRKETFTSIVEQNKAANEFVLNWTTKNHLFLFDKIHTLNTRNSHGKLAYTLLNLERQNNDVNVFQYLSRKDLAELSSISIESTNKIIAQLKNDGIISVNSEGIKIERLDLIERLSTVG